MTHFMSFFVASPAVGVNFVKCGETVPIYIYIHTHTHTHIYMKKSSDAKASKCHFYQAPYDYVQLFHLNGNEKNLFIALK